MLKLLRADFRRLLRSKAFTVPAALMLVAGLLMPVIHYIDLGGTPGLSFDLYFSDYTVVAVILLAVFASLFIGTEYSDGTIRNKLIAGHSRVNIYLSELAVCLAAGVIMCAAYAGAYLAVGLPLLGDFSGGAKQMLLVILASFAMQAAFAALFTLVAMLCHSKAHTSVICILLAIVLFASGILIANRLSEPEYYSSYSTSINGEVVEEPGIPNPSYLSGTQRQVYAFLYDYLPGCQTIRLFALDKFNAGTFAMWDALTFALASCAGVLAFRKKDIK